MSQSPRHLPPAPLTRTSSPRLAAPPESPVELTPIERLLAGRLLLSLASTARALDCSDDTVRREIDRGRLEAIRLPYGLRVTVVSLRQYVEETPKGSSSKGRS